MSSDALKWANKVMPRKPNGDPDPIAKHILLQLCSMASGVRKDNRVWPSQRTLSQLTGWGKSAVADALDRLEAGGYIERERRHHPKGARKGQRTSDMIVLLVDPEAQDDMLTRREQPQALKRASNSDSVKSTERHSFGISLTDRASSSHRHGGTVRASVSDYRFYSTEPRHDMSSAGWTMDDVNDEVLWLITQVVGYLPPTCSDLINRVEELRARYRRVSPAREAEALDWIFESQLVVDHLTRKPGDAADVILRNLQRRYEA